MIPFCKNMPLCCNGYTRILLLSFLIVIYKGHAQEWELKKDKKGVKVYTRESASSKIKEYKAVMLVKTSLDTALKILTDGDNLWKWNHRTPESKTVKIISDNEFVFWMNNNLPWPLKNRYHLSRIKVLRKENDTIIINISPETIYTIPEAENSIRIENFKGYWSLIPQGDYVEITQQLYGDPGGNIPTWVINTVLASAPYNSFLNLKELLEN